MRVAILRYNQDPNSRAWLFTSVSKSKELVASGTHARISKKLIRELFPDSTPSTNPSKFYEPSLAVEIRVEAIPKLNPPLPPSTLNLFYPVNDMSSFAAQHRQEVWGCSAEEFARRVGF